MLLLTFKIVDLPYSFSPSSKLMLNKVIQLIIPVVVEEEENKIIKTKFRLENHFNFNVRTDHKLFLQI